MNQTITFHNVDMEMLGTQAVALEGAMGFLRARAEELQKSGSSTEQAAWWYLADTAGVLEGLAQMLATRPEPNDGSSSLREVFERLVAVRGEIESYYDDMPSEICNALIGIETTILNMPGVRK